MIHRHIRYSVFLAFAALFPLLPGCKTQRAGACPDCGAAIAGTSAAGDLSSSAFSTGWLPPEQRKAAIPAFAFENQDAKKISLADFRGSPVALSFIYTRCQNQRKCPLVARTMAELAATATSVSPGPKLLLISYDPDFDTPARLNSFGKAHGFAASRDAMLLRPEPAAKETLFGNLNVRVNYNEQGVNLHGIQLLLLDKEGRYVRSYHSLLWRNEEVMNDLARLAAE